MHSVRTIISPESTTCKVMLIITVCFLCLAVHPHPEPLLHGGHDRQLLRHRDRHHGRGHHCSGLLHCRALLTTGQHTQTAAGINVF